MNPKLDTTLRIIEVIGGLVFVGAMLEMLFHARRALAQGD